MSSSHKIPGFRGRVLTSDDTEYELARLTGNAAFDSHPVLIARSADAADVVAAVRWARATGQTLALRSGGHSVSGHSTGDGVAVLDLGALNDMTFDDDDRTAWVGPGVKAADFTKAAYERGGAVSFGDTGTVALGGLIPGGGIGWLVRKYGLTIDSLLAAELVTADGETLTVSANVEPDLFWALRGGGSNFGVVTRYLLHPNPIGQVLNGTLLMRATNAVVRAVMDYGQSSADDLTLMPYIMAIPPVVEVPVAEHGRLGLWVDTLWAGNAEAGDRVLAGLRAIGPILMDTMEQKPFPQVYPEPSGDRSAWTASSIYLDTVDDGVVETIIDELSAAPLGANLAILRILGGAAGRVANDATAYGWRDRRFLAWLIADYAPVDVASHASHAAWVCNFRAALADRGSGAFVNFTAADDPVAVASAYPPATLARLRSLKRRWDPDNLFRHNHNILPAEA
ncbi:MAG: FAD-binding oxidoreductase [Candidatus Limnocylindrales bacterium]